MNGYAKPCKLDTTVRADMLETVAGYTDDDMHRELSFAIGTLDVYDPDSCRWMMALLDRRIAELEA